MNKKALSLLAVVALGSFAGCGNTNTSSSSSAAPAPAAKKYSVGLGYSETFKTSGQLDLTVAMAAFDDEGKVYDVRFDVVQVKFTSNEAKDGLTLTNTNVDADYSVTSKLELGTAYNMQGASFIGKEVDEQIEAFADYCAGKTVAEVIESTVNPGHSSDGTPVCDALTGKVTITVDGFEAALQNAFDTKSEATYELAGTAGVAMVSGLAYNYGKPTKEVACNIAGAFAKDGKIEVALMDEVVCPVAIAEDGTLSLDTASKYVKEGKVISKKALGYDYAMKGTSAGIGKIEGGAEWFEQAAVIEAAAAGKTATEVTALVAGEGELAGATMTVTSYLKAIAKAATYAEKTVIAAR